MRRIIVTLALAALTVGTATAENAPEVHPDKTAFKDYASWPATSPADVSLKAFAPFRAVYRRNYKQAGGPEKGAPRQDRVIITAEDVGWDGNRSVLINMSDSGIPEQADTNGRSLAMYTSRDNLRLFYEMGPIPGKAKDYYLLRVLPEKLVGSMVTTDSGEVQHQGGETSAPGVGPLAWAMANLDLEKGRKIRLEPSYSPQGNPLTFVSHGRVAGREAFVDAAGNEHRAWVVESFWSLKDARLLRIYLVPEPPYYLGTEYFDLDTGKTTDFVRLVSFVTLEP